MTPLRGLIALVLLAVIAAVFYVAVGDDDTDESRGLAETQAGAEEPEQVGGPGELPQVALPGEAESDAEVPAEVRAEVVAESTSMHRVFGRVIDEAGSPIEGAEVTLAQRLGRRFRDAAEEKNSARRTAQDGRFLFEEVAPERGLTLCVRLERHADVTREIPESLAGDLDLGDLVAELGGSLAGRVLDEAGNPVAGAEVKAWHRKLTEGPNVDILFSLDLSGVGVRATTADASGFFLLHGLPAGEAIALARAEGYTSESVTGISIRKGGLTGDVTITLSSGGAIEGVVVDDATGRPIEGALVAVSDTVIDISEPGFSTAVAQNREVQSAANGCFRLKGLKERAYDVTASKDRFLPQRAESVVPGTSNLRLALRPSGLLYGCVRDRKNGEAVADFTAAVRPTRYDSGFGYGPGSRGEAKVLRGKEAAEIAGVAENPGLFAIFCALPGAEFSLDITADGFPSCRIEPIRVESGARVQVDVELTPEIEVSGIVLDSRGNPVADASVIVQRSKDNGHSTREGDRTIRLGGYSHIALTDEEGRFWVPM
ncbi:MAG: carboxypeptidase regulatory-like domain-containing protein, partial [Planctomycetes bacterium]|nr:carboxypeptidase regulatory-like domain-containing protein [Planctomycetota bacterium]